jgi:hypothetical protein
MEELDRMPPQKLKCIIHALVDKFGEEAFSLVQDALTRNKKCWLLELPQDVMCHILSTWIPAKDICRLDSAACAKSVRPGFLVWFSSNAVISLNTAPKRINKPCLQWLTGRKLKLQGLRIDSFRVGYISEDLLLFLQYGGSSLTKLDFGSYAHFDADTLQEILLLCQNLTDLDMEHCVVDHTLLGYVLGMLSKLRRLDISRAAVEMTTVPALDAAVTRWDCLPSTVISCTALEELHLNGDKHVTDCKLAAFAAACPNLQIVSLCRAELLTSASVISIAEHCPRLRELYLDKSAAGDDVMVALTEHCRELRVLSANFAQISASDNGLLGLFDHCPHLTKVRLAYNERLTDHCLRDIHIKCPRLQVLQLNGCRGLTPHGVLGAIRSCAVLQTLDIRDFPVEFDQAVRRELFEKKLWLGPWKDRNLKIQQTSEV